MLGDNALPNELSAEPPDDTVADAGRKKRAEFARQYLEKLINIEVPVPIPTADASRGLIVPQESKVQDSRPGTKHGQVVAGGRRHWRNLASVV